MTPHILEERVTNSSCESLLCSRRRSMLVVLGVEVEVCRAFEDRRGGSGGVCSPDIGLIITHVREGKQCGKTYDAATSDDTR
jgi:hypothetical protein